MSVATARRPLHGRVFYGWWIAGAAAVIQLLFSVLLHSSYGAYVKYLRDDFGWSRTLFSVAHGMRSFESGLLGPIEGMLIDRFGPRVVMRVGLVMLGAGFLLFSQMNSPAVFFIAFTLMSVGAALGGFMPLAVALVNWFERRRATALAVMSLGFALGGLLLPLVVLSLEHAGWRATAVVSAIILLGVGLPVSQVVRHRPESYGYTVDGLPPREADDALPSAEFSGYDFTLREALRTRSFWFVSLGHASAVLVISALMVHLFTHVTENLGYSIAMAGVVSALLPVMQIVGQAVGGYIGDRWSKRWITVACMYSHAAAMVLIAFANALWLVVAFTALHGIAWGIRGPLMSAIRADYFGRANYGKIMGFSSLVVMLGNFSGPLLAGVLADRTGNYQAGFTTLAVLAALGATFFIVVRPPARPVRLQPAVEQLRTAAPVAGD